MVSEGNALAVTAAQSLSEHQPGGIGHIVVDARSARLHARLCDYHDVAADARQETYFVVGPDGVRRVDADDCWPIVLWDVDLEW